MMRRLPLALAVALAACGSDPDPHAVGGCDGWTNNDGTPFTGMCEAACATPPADTGESCDTMKQLNCRSTEFGGVEGCCIAEMSTIVFFECAN